VKAPAPSSVPGIRRLVTPSDSPSRLDLTLEEAGELVLESSEHYPWMPCERCDGGGRINIGVPVSEAKPDGYDRIKCTTCDGAGFFLSQKHKRAYEMLGAVIPSKPLTSTEHIQNTIGNYMKNRLNDRSITRRLLPATLVSKEDDEV
jgi:hypothetical protein